MFAKVPAPEASTCRYISILRVGTGFYIPLAINSVLSKGWLHCFRINGPAPNTVAFVTESLKSVETARVIFLLCFSHDASRTRELWFRSLMVSFSQPRFSLFIFILIFLTRMQADRYSFVGGTTRQTWAKHTCRVNFLE